MKKTIQFSKFFLPSAILSCALIAFGIAGYFTKGFTLGVDFKSGLIQEIKIVPTAFSLKWHGTTNAALSFNRDGIRIVLSGSGTESQAFPFPFSQYTTIGSLTRAMDEQLEDLEVILSSSVREDMPTQWLVFSSFGNPSLNDETPFIVYFFNPASPQIDISEVRTALAGINGVSVQNIGSIQNREFMIRSEDNEGLREASDQIIQALETFFGEGEIAVLRIDFVDQRFSALTVSSSLKLLSLTLLVILVYASIRFKPKFALGAVIGILHDGIIVVAFIVWSQMEFTTSIIAAILTILGYSINNTIVVFDRIRENRNIYPDNSFTEVLNISLTNVLGRTIITTVTTMLAISFLVVFVKGSMKDFAIALIVGMTSGVYTSLFIAPGFVSFMENVKRKKAAG